METTYQETAKTAEKVQATATNVSSEGKISRKALIGFLSGAAIVFTIAIYYCVSTGYGEVGGILAGAFALVSIFAVSVYRSFR